ncbi:uncharacterized protein MEPE_03199 [Melanopsichium pennsylvanicum]|uniref:Uncharacterized protein n=1 Tax=Melanopsichium pennsylvanicum TaxID=63383 RepID=A0AAJ4XLP4_9BASI|nr:uncharacterized protein MEPE_03199 [Melanopsichium pennsylvanicum]
MGPSQTERKDLHSAADTSDLSVVPTLKESEIDLNLKSECHVVQRHAAMPQRISSAFPLITSEATYRAYLTATMLGIVMTKSQPELE